MSKTIVAEPTTYANTWTMGVDGKFNDHKKEALAIELAKGRTAREAASAIGINYKTALHWMREPAMRERKRLLRSSPAISQTYTVSIAMILAELHMNSTMAREDRDFKASNEALMHMYKIAKADKSLLESFDAGVAGSKSSDVVGALQAHLSKAQALSAQNERDDE